MGGGIWRKLYLQKVCSFGIYYLYLHHESNLFGRDGFFLVGNLQSKMQLLRGETIRIGVFQGRAERCLILRSEPENGDFWPKIGTPTPLNWLSASHFWPFRIEMFSLFGDYAYICANFQKLFKFVCKMILEQFYDSCRRRFEAHRVFYVPKAQAKRVVKSIKGKSAYLNSFSLV